MQRERTKRINNRAWNPTNQLEAYTKSIRQFLETFNLRHSNINDHNKKVFTIQILQKYNQHKGKYWWRYKGDEKKFKRKGKRKHR